MSSLSVKRSNIDSNSFKSKFDFKSKYELDRGKKLNSTNNKTTQSLKSRIFKLLFNTSDNNDDSNMDIDNDTNTNKRDVINKTEMDKNKAFEINIGTKDEETNGRETVDSLEVENREFISYKDIKAIFDEIDRKFSSEGGENWSEKSVYLSQQYGNNINIINNSLTNCEIHSPIMETSEYGEVPIWEQNQNIPSLSFVIRAEDNSDLKGESNFVLIHLSDLYCSNIDNYDNYDNDTLYDSSFCALNNNDTELIMDDGEFEFL